MKEIDITILNFIEKIRNPFLDKLMVFITKLGDNGIIWIVLCALLLISRKTRRIGFTTLLALLFGEITGNIIFKNIFRRARPFTLFNKELLIDIPHGFSFPSGHTTSSFASCNTISHFSNKILGIMFYILAILIAFSRMYLYVHYPSDIIGGIVLGLICSFLAVKLYNTLKKRKLIHF